MHQHMLCAKQELKADAPSRHDFTTEQPQALPKTVDLLQCGPAHLSHVALHSGHVCSDHNFHHMHMPMPGCHSLHVVRRVPGNSEVAPMQPSKNAGHCQNNEWPTNTSGAGE